MLRNYFLLAFRVFKKQKLNTLLNLLGMAIAIASCLLIYSHVQNELSFEECYPKADRIYRINIDAKYGNSTRNWTTSPLPLGPEIKKYFSSVEDYTRISSGHEKIVMKYESPKGEVKTFEEDGGMLADNSIISMLNISFTSGDYKTALEDVGSIVLTQSMAVKYFGNENPINKTIFNLSYDLPMKVTGVIPDRPENTHLQFDFLISTETWFHLLRNGSWKEGLESRTWKAVTTYILLKRGALREDIQSKLPEFQNEFHANNPERKETFLLQPISKIHLYSHRETEPVNNSDISYVYILSLVAIFILIIAIVNFINISLAQNFKRFKEVAARKIIGAQKNQLLQQFISELFLFMLAAVVVSLAIVLFALPLYNNLAQKNITLGQIVSLDRILLLGGLILFIIMTVGLYLAYAMTRPSISNTFLLINNPKSSVSIARKVLIIFQFTISVFMIIATITVFEQLQYIKNVNLGFDKSGLVAINIKGDLSKRDSSIGKVFKDQLKNYSGVIDATFASNLPGEKLSIEHLIPIGQDWDEVPTVKFVYADQDYLKTMEINLIQGIGFNDFSGNKNQFILNEAAVEALNVLEPIGKKCKSYRGEGEIVGIVKNFNFESLHRSIESLVIEYSSMANNYLILRCTGKNVKEILDFAKAEYNKQVPDYPFTYSFIDDNLARLYNFETNLGNVFKTFAFLSLLISCVGLFGLSVYASELRIKEIGIRKVLGATAAGISALLTKEFLIWVILANIIAYPIAYYFMTEWLDKFAYKTELSIEVFIAAALLSVSIALVTVSYQSVKAAMANPINSIKYE